MFLKSSNSFVNAVVGGWEISPVVVCQSGLPYTLSYSDLQSKSTRGCAVLSKRKPEQPQNGHKGCADSWRQRAVLHTEIASRLHGPGLDQIGNAGRNTAWGPRFFNSDMSIAKNVTFHERYTAQFRMDAYNAFNHINFGNPNGTIDSTSGGQISGGPFPASIGGTTNPRQLQFTIHLAF